MVDVAGMRKVVGGRIFGVFIKAEAFELNFRRKVRLSEANKTERVAH